MKSNRVIRVQDRYELTFVIFVRENNPTQGKIYHEPTLSSKKRLARVVAKMFDNKTLRVDGFADNPHVFNYVPLLD